MGWWLFFSAGERSYLEAARSARRCSAHVHDLATEHCSELAKAHYVDVDIPEESWLDWDLIEE